MRALLVLFLSLTTARAEPPPRASHVRFATAHGPLHAWWPAAYEATSADLVIYIHGYSTDVDRAWREHRLAQQFAASGLNAMFVAGSAPRGHGQRVRWRSLDAMVRALRARLDSPLPGGRTIVVGHSGAHRTIAQWLTEGDSIDALVLVDAHYGEQPQIRAWIKHKGAPERRLIEVAAVTRRWADALHATLPEALVLDELPEALDAARASRIVYVRTATDHMELVTLGQTIPRLLQMLSTPAPR